MYTMLKVNEEKNVLWVDGCMNGWMILQIASDIVMQRIIKT